MLIDRLASAALIARAWFWASVIQTTMLGISWCYAWRLIGHVNSVEALRWSVSLTWFLFMLVAISALNAIASFVYRLRCRRQGRNLIIKKAQRMLRLLRNAQEKYSGR